MHYSQIMEVPDGIYYRTNHHSGLQLAVVALLHNPIEQLPSSHQFQHQAILILILVDLKQLHNVRMVDLSERSVTWLIIRT